MWYVGMRITTKVMSALIPGEQAIALWCEKNCMIQAPSHITTEPVKTEHAIVSKRIRINFIIKIIRANI